MTTEAETLAALRANQEAARRALDADDMTALRALAEQERRYIEILGAIWQQQREA